MSATQRTHASSGTTASEAASKADFASFLGNAMNELVPDGKTRNAMYKGQSDSDRANAHRRRQRTIRRNGGRVPAMSRQELMARRKWERANEALAAAGLQWFEGGGKPRPEKADPDPTRTHLLPPKHRNPAPTRSDLIARRKAEHHALSASLAPKKEHSIHPVNIPKVTPELGTTVGWWQEDRHNLLDGVDRGLGTTTWGASDGLDRMQTTIVDGGYISRGPPGRAATAAARTRNRQASWGLDLQFPNMATRVTNATLGSSEGLRTRVRGGTPRPPTPQRHPGGRVKVADGLTREEEPVDDPFKKREAPDGEVTMKRTRRKQVALKVSHVRHDTAHLARPQHRISHTFTDSVLAFGPMTKQPERFPKDSSLDEFGKSRVMLATEVAAVPSDFAAGSASQRLTKAFGPPRNVNPEHSTLDADNPDPAIVFGNPVPLARCASAPAGVTRGFISADPVAVGNGGGRYSQQQQQQQRRRRGDGNPPRLQLLHSNNSDSGGPASRDSPSPTPDSMFSPVVHRPMSVGSPLTSGRHSQARTPTTFTAESWHRAVGGGGGSPGSRRGKAKHLPAQRWETPAHRAAVRRQRLNRARSSDPTALRQQVGLAKSGSAPGLAPAPLPRRRRASLLKVQRPKSPAIVAGAARWAPNLAMSNIRTGGGLGSVSRW